VGDAGDDSEFHRRNANSVGRGVWEKESRELNCNERAGFSRIQVHMTSVGLNRFCRTLILLGGLLEFSAQAQFSFVFTNGAPRVMPRRANILFIQCDGLGYGDLSCYGQTHFQTPNLDKLATEGIRFTNYYAIYEESAPSHAALMLGKGAGHLRQRADGNIPLAADDVTVAQILKNSGYHTGLIGEWDLGDENSSGAPWKKGFDEFAGYLNPDDAENYYADYIFRYAPHGRFSPTNNQWTTFIGHEPLYYNAGGRQGTYIPDLFTKAALNFVKVNQPDPFNHYRPFFLLLNYATPRANLAEAERTGNGMQVPTDAPYSDESWPPPEKNRAAMIARLDGDIGKLLEQLKRLNIESNMVIFFSNAGLPQKAGGVDPDFFGSIVSSNDLRMPMIASWPGKIPAGQISGFRWTAADFLPTATDIALLKPPANIDGVSILPVLTGQTQTNRAGGN
jgi:arylsulfatase A-like enzyme